jgi:hypothetical protein
MKERREDVSWFRPEPWLGRAPCVGLETMAGGGEVWTAVSPKETQASALNKAHFFLRYINSELTKRHILSWTRYISRNKMGSLYAQEIILKEKSWSASSECHSGIRIGGLNKTTKRPQYSHYRVSRIFQACFRFVKLLDSEKKTQVANATGFH